MRASIKAAMLSALVFPGAGHLLLKSYKMAAVLATIAAGGTAILIMLAIDMATTLVDKIQRGEVSLDPDAIAAAINMHTTTAQAQSADLATYAIIIAWLLGTVDAYRRGQAIDKNPKN